MSNVPLSLSKRRPLNRILAIAALTAAIASFSASLWVPRANVLATHFYTDRRMLAIGITPEKVCVAYHQISFVAKIRRFYQTGGRLHFVAVEPSAQVQFGYEYDFLADMPKVPLAAMRIGAWGQTSTPDATHSFSYRAVQIPFPLIGTISLVISVLVVLRGRHDVSQMQCPKCRYDLRGSLDSAVCPECGSAISDEQKAKIRAALGTGQGQDLQFRKSV